MPVITINFSTLPPMPNPTLEQEVRGVRGESSDTELYHFNRERENCFFGAL